MTDESQTPAVKDGQAGAVIRGDGNPITFSPILILDVVGALLLGVLSILLLLALQQERARSQKMIEILLEVRNP